MRLVHSTRPLLSFRQGRCRSVPAESCPFVPVRVRVADCLNLVKFAGFIYRLSHKSLHPPCPSPAAQLSALAEALNSCKEFGFDLEAHNARTYHGLSCLLQISTETKVRPAPPLGALCVQSVPAVQRLFPWMRLRVIALGTLASVFLHLGFSGVARPTSFCCCA